MKDNLLFIERFSWLFKVVVTNQITTRVGDPCSDKTLQEVADLDSGDMETDDDGSSHVMAALGNTWSHAVNTRLIVQYLDDIYRQVLSMFT